MCKNLAGIVISKMARNTINVINTSLIQANIDKLLKVLESDKSPLSITMMNASNKYHKQDFRYILLEYTQGTMPQYPYCLFSICASQI